MLCLWTCKSLTPGNCLGMWWRWRRAEEGEGRWLTSSEEDYFSRHDSKVYLKFQFFQFFFSFVDSKCCVNPCVLQNVLGLCAEISKPSVVNLECCEPLCFIPGAEWPRSRHRAVDTPLTHPPRAGLQILQWPQSELMPTLVWGSLINPPPPREPVYSSRDLLWAIISIT